MQGGFVFIEMIIVLIIIVIGVGLGLVVVVGMFSLFNVNEEQCNISVIVVNVCVLKIFLGYGFSGINLILSLIVINGVLKNMSVFFGVVYNVYGGLVIVLFIGMGFLIIISKLFQDVCIMLVIKIVKNIFEQIKINSGFVIIGEVIIVVVIQVCSSDSNSIIWIYSL